MSKFNGVLRPAISVLKNVTKDSITNFKYFVATDGSVDDYHGGGGAFIFDTSKQELVDYDKFSRTDLGIKNGGNTLIEALAFQHGVHLTQRVLRDEVGNSKFLFVTDCSAVLQHVTRELEPPSEKLGEIITDVKLRLGEFAGSSIAQVGREQNKPADALAMWGRKTAHDKGDELVKWFKTFHRRMLVWRHEMGWLEI